MNIGTITTAINDAIQWVTERLASLWHRHETRMHENTAYRAVIASALAGILAELTLGPIAAAVASAAAGAYAAAHGTTSSAPDRWGDGW